MDGNGLSSEARARIAACHEIDRSLPLEETIGAIGVRFGAAIEALLNRRVDTSADQFNALVSLLSRADSLSAERDGRVRSLDDYLAAVERSAADERETAVAVGAPVGEAFRLGHALRCFGRAVAPLLAGDDECAHRELVASGATVVALVADLVVVGA